MLFECLTQYFSITKTSYRDKIVRDFMTHAKHFALSGVSHISVETTRRTIGSASIALPLRFAITQRANGKVIK